MSIQEQLDELTSRAVSCRSTLDTISRVLHPPYPEECADTTGTRVGEPIGPMPAQISEIIVILDFVHGALLNVRAVIGVPDEQNQAGQQQK